MLTPRKSRRVGSSLVDNSSSDPGGAFKYTTILLHADGTNGQTNDTYLDTSTNSFTVSVGGSPGQGTFSPFALSGWSGKFPGGQASGIRDWLTFPADTAFAFGTDDFTIECFIRLVSYSAQNTIIGDYNTTTGLNFLWYVTSSTINFSHSGGTVSKSYSFSFDTWYHVAVSRQSSTLRFFVNGTQVSTSDTVTTNIANTNSVLVGANNDDPSFPKWPMDGYISNLRITKGFALYTTTFTIPSRKLTVDTYTSFLILVDGTMRDLGPSQLSSSTYRTGVTGTMANYNAIMTPFSSFDPNFKYSAPKVGGSSYHSGSDSLTVQASSAWDFGSSNFTIECWVYRLDDSTGGLIQHNYSGSANYQLMITGSNTVTFTYNSGATLSSPSGTVRILRWCHVAVVRNGSSLAIYINGVSVASTTAANIVAGGSPSTLVIGSGLVGYISSVRVDTAATYESNFPLAETPPTANGNTQLLLNFTNSGISDNAGRINMVKASGTPVLSTTQSVFGGTSIYFNGSSYYTISDPVMHSFRPSYTESWTVEFWYYPLDTRAQGLFTFAGSPPTNIGFAIQLASGGRAGISQGSGISFGNSIAGVNCVPANTWTYIAMTKSGNDLSLYTNGTLRATAVQALSVDTNYNMWIGYGLGGGGGALNFTPNPAYGYMDEFRYTKGLNRYPFGSGTPSGAFYDK